MSRLLLVTVIREEDNRVRKLRDKDPPERYRLSEIGEIDEAGEWQPLVQNPPVYLPNI